LIRSFIRTKVPPFKKVLLVESGSRDLLEDLIPGIYKSHKDVQIDLVTCYASQPKALNDQARVFRVTDYGGGGSGREKLLQDVSQQDYDVLGLICSAEPIMTKWKWWLAWKLPAKPFALNENGDYFWIDRAHWDIVLHFVLFRIGMTGAGAPAAIARLLFLPISATGLVLFACAAHLRRWLR
jgi:hypothetical protein